MKKLELLSVDEAITIWPNLVKQVKASLSRNGNLSETLFHDIEVGITSGVVRVVFSPKGFGLVAMDGDVLMLVSYVGQISEIQELAKEMEAMAREHGAKSVRVVGPRAWMRVFPGLKYKSMVMEWTL